MSETRTFTVTGIISEVEPSSPMMPLWRSCFREPTTSVAFASFTGWNDDPSTIRTSPDAMGISTGPRLRN